MRRRCSRPPLHLDHLPVQPVAKHDIDLYHTVATVTLADGVTCSFDGGRADIRFVPELERMNFCELAPGTRTTTVAANCSEPLRATDQHGAPATARFFSLVDGGLRTRRAAMPAMLTRDERGIRQNSLCYPMERMSDGA